MFCKDPLVRIPSGGTASTLERYGRVALPLVEVIQFRSAKLSSCNIIAIARISPKFVRLAVISQCFSNDVPRRFLSEEGYSFTASAEKEIVPVVKEKPCYVCLDFGTEHKSLAQADDRRMCMFSRKVTSSLLRRTFPLRETAVPSTVPMAGWMSIFSGWLHGSF